MNESTEEHLSQAEKLSALWEEYRYRHDLVWRILVTSGILVSTLSVIPYTSSEVTRAYSDLILLVPMGSLVAVVSSALVLNRESKLMELVYKKYDACSKELLEIDHDLRNEKSKFPPAVILLLAFGIIISIGYAVLIKYLWLPHLTKCAS